MRALYIIIRVFWLFYPESMKYYYEHYQLFVVLYTSLTRGHGSCSRGCCLVAEAVWLKDVWSVAWSRSRRGVTALEGWVDEVLKLLHQVVSIRMIFRSGRDTTALDP